MAYVKNPTVDSWDIAKQLDYYKANPNEAQQEIERAKGVGGSTATNWASQLQSGLPVSNNNYTPPGSTSAKQTVDYVNSGQLLKDTGKTSFNGIIQPNGSIIDTTGLTAQQAYARDVTARDPANAPSILSSMGLDMNGNPKSGGSGGTYNGDAVSAQLSQANAVPAFSQAATVPAVSQRVQPTINVDDITKTVTGSVNDQIAAQIAAYNQQLAKSQQANQLAVTQNNTALEQQLKQLGESKTLANDEAQTVQNRRGGWYSGGLDYQMGSNNRAYAQQEGNVRQDVTARNADIWGKNAQLASQAAENIQQLQSQAPNLIRQRIMEELDKQRGMDIQDRDYNLKAQNQSFNQQQDVVKTQAQYGGVYNPSGMSYNEIKDEMARNSADYAKASPEEQTRLHNRNLQLASAIGSSYNSATGEYSQDQGYAGYKTIDAQQLDYNKYRDQVKDIQYQQKFDEDVRQFGITTAIDQAYKQGQLSLQQRNAAINEYEAQTGRMNSYNAADRLSWETSSQNPDNQYKNAEIAKINSSIDSKSTQNMEKAITLAQKDPTYQYAKDDSARQAIINYYVDLINKSAGGSSDQDIAQYLKNK